MMLLKQQRSTDISFQSTGIHKKKEEVPILDRDGNPALDRNGKPKVKKENRLEKEETGYVMQFPMKLGYAVTIHKSQGQTYDAVNLTPEIFLDGQLYVALSRCRTVEGIYCQKPLQERMVKTCRDVL
ncbi:MAG: ATP-binding domain-containing protein, partial [Ruminococcus sp.]|nr:ATP-binding domain-containing protein [Ruminococcus sp.]